MTNLYSSTPHQAQGSVPSFTDDTKVKWGDCSLCCFCCYCDKQPDRRGLRKVYSGSWIQRILPIVAGRLQQQKCELLTWHSQSGSRATQMPVLSSPPPFCAQLSFSFFCSAGPQLVEWNCPHVEWLFPQQLLSLETTSLACLRLVPSVILPPLTLAILTLILSWRTDVALPIEHLQ